MSWRTVCITRRCKLEYRMGYLVVRDTEILRIHLSEISILILESTAISMTASLLSELNKQKIKVIFCDEKHNPFGEIVPYYGSHDSSRRIRDQIDWCPQTKEQVWKAIVTKKIRKQADLLERQHKLEEATILRSYIPEVLPGDKTNREGHAAKVYFNVIFGKGFARSVQSPINAALDYGYTLLSALFNREITSQGRITQLGIWHDNTFNQFNLSSDLMEVFRPFVDERVLQLDLVNEFTREHKHKLLEMFEDEISVNGTKYKMLYGVKLFVVAIMRVLDTNDLSHIPTISYA